MFVPRFDRTKLPVRFRPIPTLVTPGTCRAVIDRSLITPRGSKLRQRLASLTDRIDGPMHGAILAAVHTLNFLA
jgi:hypothetical protein